ncbi:MAG: flagellar filament capping protein FliD [Persephonella sp.]|nr:flagellar filament capping protein FliD [Persephonella sp.]
MRGDDTAGVFSEDAAKTYETVSAQDAQIVLNGITFNSSTNTFDNIITGVSITVKDVGTTDITITQDTGSIKSELEKIIDGYNQLLQTVQKATGKDAPLAGESSLNTMVSSIFRLISDGLGRYGIIDTASDDAETTKGLLKINSDAFNEFIKIPEAKTVLQELCK